MKGELYNIIGNKLFTAAVHNDINAVFEMGIISLKYNRIGFAWAFFKQAGDNGHQEARKYLIMLVDQNIPISMRIGMILDSNEGCHFLKNENGGCSNILNGENVC